MPPAPHYSVPSIIHSLHHARVPTGRFLPTMAPWRLMSMNLRNHRKIMVVDGKLGFTGGMNIREGNCVAQFPRHPVRDLHFRLEGPVVAQLQEAFANDWAFVTGESLRGRRLVSGAGAGRSGHRPRHPGRAGRGFREAALDHTGGALLRAGVGHGGHALLSCRTPPWFPP